MDKKVKQTSDKYFHLMRLLLVLDNINLLFSKPQAIFPRCFLCQVNDKAEFQHAEKYRQVADCLPNIHCIEGSHFWPIWPRKLMNFQYKNGQTSVWLFYNFTLESVGTKISKWVPASFSTWIKEVAAGA